MAETERGSDMLKTIKDAAAALGEFELALGELLKAAPAGEAARENDEIIQASLGLMQAGVQQLRTTLERELAKPPAVLFADMVNDFDDDDAKKASTAMVTCISILDRCKLHEGLELTTEHELERYAALVLAELRIKTGNANLPRGGVQA
jgi:hypothetical protein